MNSITLVGNLGKDVEIRSTGQGKRVASFSIADSSGSGDKKHTDWFNVSIWDERLIELAENYLKKGRQVAIVGTLKLREWEDKNGAKHFSPDVTAKDIQFVSSPKKESQDSTENGQDDIPF